MRTICWPAACFVGLFPWLVGASAGDEVAGRVIGVDGRPSPGSSVVLIEEGKPLVLTGPLTGPGSTRAGADGGFRLPRPGRRFALLATDRDGVAIRTAEELAASPDLALRPWGRIAGTVRLGGGLAPDRTVVMNGGWADGLLRASDFREVKSDAEGRFAFDRVLPGLALLGRTGTSTGGMPSDLRWVDVGAGQSPAIVIGGVGRPVEGRLSFPADAAAPRFTGGRAVLFHHLPPVPFPSEWAAWSGERRLAWRIAWDKTPEGTAYMRSQGRHVAPVAPDGAFRIEDVPQGSYILSVFVEHRLPDAPADATPRMVAQARREVAVPSLPGDAARSDEPLALGPVEAKVAARAPEVGEAAPDFEVRTLDGKPLRLRDLRGRYVLLDFWATWCVPCAEELPHLKAAFEASGGDGRFAMVGLSLDDRLEPARKYAEARGMAWTQGFLGEWADSPVAASYDVQGIPSIWLIGPDGQVVARDLHGPAIPATVARALGR